MAELVANLAHIAEALELVFLGRHGRHHDAVLVLRLGGVQKFQGARQPSLQSIHNGPWRLGLGIGGFIGQGHTGIYRNHIGSALLHACQQGACGGRSLEQLKPAHLPRRGRQHRRGPPVRRRRGRRRRAREVSRFSESSRPGACEALGMLMIGSGVQAVAAPVARTRPPPTRPRVCCAMNFGCTNLRCTVASPDYAERTSRFYPKSSTYVTPTSPSSASVRNSARVATVFEFQDVDGVMPAFSSGPGT